MKRGPVSQSRRTSQRGNSAIETALILAPLLLFVLMTIELGRGMWTYHTLAFAVKQGSRYTALHGARCVSVSSGCQSTIGAATGVITQMGMGLDPSQLQLTFNAGTQSYACASATGCASDATNWPPSSNNAAGQSVNVTAKYNFQSVLSFLWAGQFGLSAGSTEVIEF